jgi:hypothetical protein
MAIAMTAEVAEMLREYGLRLSLSRGNPYRARAYVRAAQNLAALGESLEDLIASHRLTDIPHWSAISSEQKRATPKSDAARVTPSSYSSPDCKDDYGADHRTHEARS